MGLRLESSYEELIRAVSEQPLKLPHPNRVGLRTYEDVFFNNLVNDQAAYQGDHARAGFDHERPRQPPPRPDVYFDARSDGGGGGGGGGGDGYRHGDESYGDGFNDDFSDPDDGQGPWHYPFGRRPSGLPIQSGQLLPDMGPPLAIPDLPNPRHTYIEEEGLGLPPEPPGFFSQAADAANSGFQQGAVNRVAEISALAGGMAADYAATMARNRLRAMAFDVDQMVDANAPTMKVS